VNIVNEFIKQCDKEIKKKRTIYWDENTVYSIRENPADSFAGLWFRTQGCSHDRSGGCVMCDYSIGPITSGDMMIEYVKQGLSEIKNSYDTFLISPSGSMLDHKEVPAEARQKIFNLLAKTNHRSFTFETRIDTINEEVIKEAKSIFGDKLNKIFVGIESKSNFINKYCINKGITLEQITRSIEILHKYDIVPVGNILAGIPLLTYQESIDICRETIKWCSENKVKPAIFVTHVKDNTMLKKIYEMGLCDEPNLWLLIELLLQLPENINPDICWYRTYDAFNLIKAADTCPKCYHKVLDALDQYTQYKDKDILRRLDCDCRLQWKEALNKKKNNLPDRIVHTYCQLSKNIFGEEYWIKYGNAIEKMIYDDYSVEVG
jgi:radical SAM enzyme (TIGR01210 family)